MKLAYSNEILIAVRLNLRRLDFLLFEYELWLYKLFVPE